MFKHRDVPHCHHCGNSLILREDSGASNVSPIDGQWKCTACGVLRPLVYRVERSLKKPA